VACSEQLAGVSRHARGAGLKVGCAVCEAQDARRLREVCISPAISSHSKKFASSPSAQRRFCATTPPHMCMGVAFHEDSACGSWQGACVTLVCVLLAGTSSVQGGHLWLEPVPVSVR
jgi:hypothetical protein